MMSLQHQTDDILFVFPPLGNHEHPHMGLPIIKSYLSKHGFANCKIKDYNAIIMDRLFMNTMRNNNNLFALNSNAIETFLAAKNIMHGKSDSDKLKAGMAMRIISRYLRIGGVEVCKHAFDPISFYAIEKEFIKTDTKTSENSIIRFVIDEALKDIINQAPSIIGFSVVFPSQILYALLLCSEIRKVLPDTKIILGGPQVSIFYKAFLSNRTFQKQFDVIVREQGELPTLKLIKLYLYGEGLLSSIPNLAYIDENSQEIITEVTPSISMEDVGIPNYSDFQLELYAYAKLPYMFSRGCYWGKCKFCGYRGEKTRYIKSSVEKIISELKYMKETYGIRIFHLMDDAISAEFLVEIAKGIIDNNLDICYAAFLRTDKSFTSEVCQLLYKSGLRTVLFGFESADDDVLKAMDKGMNLSTMVAVLENFKNAGIMNTLSCIIGFPQETKEQAFRTIKFLEENKHLYYEAYVTPFRLMSDIVNNPGELGLYDIDFENPIRHDINGYVSLEYSYHTKEGMTPFEYLDMVNKARAVTGTGPVGAIFFR